MLLFKGLFLIRHHLSGIGLNFIYWTAKKVLKYYILRLFIPHWCVPYLPVTRVMTVGCMTVCNDKSGQWWWTTSNNQPWREQQRAVGSLCWDHLKEEVANEWRQKWLEAARVLTVAWRLVPTKADGGWQHNSSPTLEAAKVPLKTIKKYWQHKLVLQIQYFVMSWQHFGTICQIIVQIKVYCYIIVYLFCVSLCTKNMLNNV